MGNFNREDRGGRRDFGRRDFGRRSFGGHGGPREMHKAVCSNCGKECEVPFVPTGSKPVYCSDCFEKMGGRASSGGFQDRGPRRDFGRRNESGPQNNEQLEAISRKLDKILEVLVPAKVEEKAVEKPVEIKIVAPKKAKVSKKKTPGKKE